MRKWLTIAGAGAGALVLGFLLWPKEASAAERVGTDDPIFGRVPSRFETPEAEEAWRKQVRLEGELRREATREQVEADCQRDYGMSCDEYIARQRRMALEAERQRLAYLGV